jgi:nitrogen fixation protein NifU and related proteins
VKEETGAPGAEAVGATDANRGSDVAADESVYRAIVLEEFKRPRNKGALADATHTAHVRNPLCGDEIAIGLQITDGVVRDVRFDGAGCAVSQAASSLFTEHIKGMRVEEVAAMDEREIVALLGFRPNPMRMKCAVLPLRAVAAALGVDENHKAY